MVKPSYIHISCFPNSVLLLCMQLLLHHTLVLCMSFLFVQHGICMHNLHKPMPNIM